MERIDLSKLVEVLSAVRRGDFSARMPENAEGLLGKACDSLNEVIEQIALLSSELKKASVTVGDEGKLQYRARLPNARGAWQDTIDAMNQLIGELGQPTMDMSRVIGAVARGDLTQKMPLELEGRPLEGEVRKVAELVNGMVGQLGAFASEVTRVAREVGTEGKLGGQARVEGVSGTWKDLTESVNGMASNLTSQVRNIADVTKAVAAGNLSRKVTVDVRGELLELKDTVNTMVDQLSAFAAEVTRVAREVGTEGRLGGQAKVEGVSGTWRDLTDSVNGMASNLTSQVRNIADVTKAVAAGDLSRKISVDARGEILELKNTVNTMVDQLSAFAAEVTRVAREVGTEGRLGGQARVEGVSGTWQALTESVNRMASNLTNQVRGIANIVTAVARGDLKRKLVLEAGGEIGTLVETINGMIDTLAVFADQVTTVAREVGVEGKLGGQARVPSAAGTWRDLTDSVNSMAQSLTTQVRAIAEVATWVAQGDLTRSIQVAAQGEVAALKDNVNRMISNLRETTQKSTEQDWLKTNLARFTRMLQGQRDLAEVSNLILRELAPLVGAHTGVFFLIEGEGDARALKLMASWAFTERKHLANRIRPGEGIVGQVMIEKKRILIHEVPPDYIRIGSALGEAQPLELVVVPVLFENEVLALIELASLHRFSETHVALLDQLTDTIGVVLNTIAANMRTESLLKKSQGMAEELRAQQSELQETNRRLETQASTLQKSEERLRLQQEELQQQNEELEERSRMLQRQNAEVERKNREIDLARRSVEEKAAQLSTTSRYKSEFLANMSHELRTPLNSLLILSRLLADNPEGNLLPKQVEFAQTIHNSGADLLTLINDILDLSKIESGTMQVDYEEVDLAMVRDQLERSFRELAAARGLEFRVNLDPDLPGTLRTDARRLQQILKNLLSNAFKFTDKGSVVLSIHRTHRDGRDIAFDVVDTGIGIPKEKQDLIFEAFQQAEGSTSRKYGGTGLGLSISRQLARLLGGELQVVSEPGAGSTFTLSLPLRPGKTAAGQAPVPPVPVTEPGDEGALLAVNALRDDRDAIRPGDRTLLIIEDDPTFSRLLLDLARDNGFKGLVALRGDVGLALARRYVPEAITLDMRLPAIDGWTVLDRLKHDPHLRHIPVHVISAAVEDRQRSLQAGAMAVLDKPVSPEALTGALQRTREFLDRRVKTLLIVEDDAAQRQSIQQLIGNGDVESLGVGTAHEALEVARNRHVDCVVLDLGLPDLPGMELIRRLRDEVHAELPIIVYTGREMTEEEERELRRLTESIIVKSARSPEHLLDETSLFLHRVEANLPEAKRRMIRQAQQSDPQLSGLKVLVVDDDARNLFAIASILERFGMQLLFADNGRQAIELVNATPDLSAVLMDVMMPEMDGYETMRRIRAEPAHADLPIIAVTAKAMKEDRAKCIEAGASDYITKPVDADQIVSLLRVWTHGRGPATEHR